jgi:CRP-like cAMP-binding protein
MNSAQSGRSGDGVSNNILNSLPKSQRDRFDSLELVSLQPGVVLYEPDQSIDYVYFPNDALISIVSLSSEGATVEIGLVGHEGMVGLPAVLGGVTPYRAVVQMGGSAYRMKGQYVSGEFRRNKAFQELLLRYTNAFLIQIAQSSICNCYHTLQERLCRWLLVARDGARSNSLVMTHDLIARLLGTRRASVTVAAGLLQKAGLISTRRGAITILDSPGLEEIACECYWILKDGSRRLLQN